MSGDPADDFRELSAEHNRVIHIEPEVAEDIARALYDVAKVLAAKHKLKLVGSFRLGSPYVMKLGFKFVNGGVRGISHAPPPFGIMKKVESVLSFIFNGYWVRNRDLQSPDPVGPVGSPSGPVE